MIKKEEKSVELKKVLDISLLSMMEIYSNPSGLEIHVCKSEKKYSSLITRKKDGAVFFQSFDGFKDKEEAIVHIEGMLEFIYETFKKYSFEKRNDIFSQLIEKGIESKTPLNSVLIGKIKEALTEKNMVKVGKIQ